ncbi:hypothetical protein D4Q80_00440 [bacterium]|nr:MAG: hypothetical protein D4Q80_00440 [bacterium]
MITSNFLKKLWLAVAIVSLTVGFSSTEVFAQHHRGRHETRWHGGRRYYYNEGRWYTPGPFWFGVNFVAPPLGLSISYLPTEHRTIFIGGVRYYEYDNVYYQSAPGGYVVVPAPVVTPNVVYEPAVSQSQTGDRETVTINVPTSTGGNMAITLVRYPNGFVGPQGEFYPTLPTTEQLRARYGR